MKLLHLLPFAIILLTACKNESQTPGNSESSPQIGTIELFLHEFRIATLARDADRLMNCMDDEYRKSQHDKFLSGRTDQFLREFFSSETSAGNYVNIDYKDITGITLTSLSRSDQPNTEYEVVYEIQTDEATVVLSLAVVKRGNAYGIYGAVG